MSTDIKELEQAEMQRRASFALLEHARRTAKFRHATSDHQQAFDQVKRSGKVDELAKLIREEFS